MPWEENGGNKGRNPWGDSSGNGGEDSKGSKSPWGSGNDRNNGQKQPDLDDVLSKFQKGMKDFLPSDFGGGKLVVLAVSALGILWLSSGLYTINPGEHAVVQRFGQWVRTEDAEGLKYHLPSPFESVKKVNVNEIRTMNIGFIGPVARTSSGPTSSALRDVPDESLMLTSDFNIVDLDFVIQWNVSSAENYIFNIEDPENTLRQVAQSAIREVVGQTRMFQIITTERGVVADKSRAIMQKILDDYKSGINISQVLINSAEVHPDVQNAFQDVQSAKQDAEDVQNRAGAYREDILPKAKGQATRVLQEAQGYKESVISRATGDADRFNSVLEAYQSGKDVTKERMYIETMESVLKNAQKIILDDKGGKGVVPYLPLNELGRTLASPSQKSSGDNGKGQ